MENIKEVIIIHYICVKCKYCFKQPNIEKHEGSNHYVHQRKIQILFPTIKYMKNMKEVILIYSIHVKSKYCFPQANTGKGSHYYPQHPCKM